MEQIIQPGSWTQTFTGLQFCAINPQVKMFRIRDIAHALACMNRFNGHSPVPYSVAQHSVIVSLECDPADARWGLMHDASEAYIGDLVTPAKKFIPQYLVVEAGIMEKVCERFGLQPQMPASVKAADWNVLAAEARDMFPVRAADWGLSQVPPKRKIKAVGWRAAEKMFLKRFAELFPEYQE